MIVVEGPDGAGKSTLIKALEEHFNVKATHFGSRPVGMQAIYERVQKSLDCKILDRWSPISQQVYGAIRGEAHSIDILDSYVHRHDPLVIYCRPPRVQLMENKMRCLQVDKQHKSEEHCETVSRNFEKIIDLYDKVISKLRSRKITIYEFDYTESWDLKDLFNFIKEKGLL